MRLNPSAFDRHLNGLAEPFVYRKAYACPCLNPASGSPLFNCPRCSGKGWLWTAPADTTAAVASSNVQLQWSKMGNYETGDLVLSIPQSSGLYEIAMFDRVTAMTSTDQRSLTLTRGAANEILHGTVKQVLRVFWIDGAENLVEGGIPLVSDAGTLSWPLQQLAPPANQQYSITYDRYAEYYCFGPFSNDRNKHGGLRLPRKMVMRRFDLFGRTRETFQA